METDGPILRDLRGRVETISYQCADWRTGELRDKEAWVYIPAENGGEEAMAYDELYVLHGRGRTHRFLFEWHHGALLREIDRLIESGVIPPTLVVSPTYRSDYEDIGYTEEAGALKPFARELRACLIPAVCARYPTYAALSDEMDPACARDHRALAGFSFGAVATWYAFMADLDLIRWFLPCCGDCWDVSLQGGMLKSRQTVDRLVAAIHRSGRSLDEFFIYAADGGLDPLHRSFEQLARALRNRVDVFTPHNFAYHLKKDGVHDYGEFIEHLSAALPQFFGECAQAEGRKTVS